MILTNLKLAFPKSFPYNHKNKEVLEVKATCIMNPSTRKNKNKLWEANQQSICLSTSKLVETIFKSKPKEALLLKK